MASELIGRALGWARGRPATARVTLHVTDNNTAAWQLYERHGFVDTGSRRPHPNLPGHEECLMALDLLSQT